MARRPSPVRRDVHARARVLAEHHLEQWFSLLTRRLLRRGDFTSPEDLDAKTTAFTIRYNKKARPWKWRYDADADHARYLQRHPKPAPATDLLPEAA